MKLWLFFLPLAIIIVCAGIIKTTQSVTLSLYRKGYITKKAYIAMANNDLADLADLGKD